MVSKAFKWARWNGHRSDLIDAIRLASKEIEVWTGCGTECSVNVKLKDGLAFSGGISALEDLNSRQLRGVRRVWIEVKPDWDEWWEKMHAKWETPFQPKVTIQLGPWGSGVGIEVEGGEHVRVEGLASQLREILKPGAPRWIPFEPLLFSTIAGVALLIAGLFLGKYIPSWIGRSDGRPGDPARIAGEVTGVVLAIAAAISLVVALPTVEILGEGEASRARRLRKVMGAAITAVALAVLAAFLFDLIKR